MERARIKFGINNKNNNETNVFVTSVQNISNKTPETIGGLTVDFSKEELELLKRASQKMKDWDTNSEQKLRTTKDFERTGFHDSQLEGDTRERLRKMLAESSEKKLDYSLEIRKLENSSKTQNQARSRRRRNVNEQQNKLFSFYQKAVRTTTEWQEWRNVSGVMKRYPQIKAWFPTRNKHLKIVLEAKRKLKKAENIQRYNEQTELLKKKYHIKEAKIARGEINKVKGKMVKGKKKNTNNLFDEFLQPATATLLHNYGNFKRGNIPTQLCDGMSGSNSALYYKDDNITTVTDFDSDKTVESNYINDTLIDMIGLKLNAKERKELNKKLKKFEVNEHETLAPHFYEDYREDIFKNEENIIGQRATPLDPLDGWQLMPYILRQKTLPPALQQDNTIEEVIRNCRYLGLETFRKLGEQKISRYVLKVHDRRRAYKNITRKTTVKDHSLLSHEEEKEFMKRITLKTIPGRLLYDHEKLYDKIRRNKFKYKKVIYNDSLCWAYRELTDLAPVYVTIVPKKNITSLDEAREEDAFLLGHMFHLCQKLAYSLKMREGYRVVINNGYAGNHNLTQFNMMLLGGRQMKYPKYYDLNHFNEDASFVDHSLSTYGDNFELSGRMADVFGSFGSLKEKRAKWLSSKYPKMCNSSLEM
uniref:Histidine triad nucleotide-binding protein 1 n=1 Tax=Cacopsylla melanoneura TaxID=428564 RepID=A0A8D9AX36_9HEMI